MLAGRLRLVSAKDLYPILNNIRGNKSGVDAIQLKRFLAGDEHGIRYDAANVVEAIIRVRHLGAGIPILRMDWDLLLNNTTPERKFFEIIRGIRHECHTVSLDARIQSYMFSGSYVLPAKPMPTWDINDFNTAFDSRVFPALVPNRHVCKALDELAQYEGTAEQGRDGELTEQTLTDLSRIGLFDSKLMLEYYGLAEHEAIGEEATQTGLMRMGAHPMQSVISGAALVLSDSAILDLPPFSNFRYNVIWIDGYIKYELHNALGHFPSEPIEIDDSRKFSSRHPASVFKNRLLAGQSNLRPYTLGNYIPTLFWGIIIDAWVRGEEPSSVSQSPFVTSLEKALKRGSLEPEEKENLMNDLRLSAIQRINRVIELWSKLQRDENKKSFAALWVGGNRAEIENVMSALAVHSQYDDEWLGWGLFDQPTAKIRELRQLRNPIHRVVKLLISDMCTYIDWVLEWPKFVQSVRAIPAGHLKSDVRYLELPLQREINKSVVMREALKPYLDREDQASPESFLESARDLCGSVDGPADLSTNPNYLDGYGQ